jgi:hypothetical protein
VLANRLKVYLAKLVNIAQKGCVPGRTLLDAISTIRDVIAYKNTAKEAGCILSIDFQNAYDVIDHGYLLKVLEHHQLGKGFVNYIKMHPQRWDVTNKNQWTHVAIFSYTPICKTRLPVINDTVYISHESFTAHVATAWKRSSYSEPH